jgi:nucleoside-diphosphate kinase
MERTLVLIKPDAIQRRLAGEVFSRLERKGLRLVGVRMLVMTDNLLREHYEHLITQPFFKGIAEFMKCGPLLATCWEGLDAVATVRMLCGITKAREAAPGTIRGDFAMSIQANLVHASDSVETAVIEVRRFFSEGELFDYKDHSISFLYAQDEAKSA